MIDLRIDRSFGRSVDLDYPLSGSHFNVISDRIDALDDDNRIHHVD